MAGNVDFEITECLSASMEEGITTKGQQEHNTVMVSAVRHKGSIGRLPLQAFSHVPGSPALLLLWPRGLDEDWIILPLTGLCFRGSQYLSR